MQTSQYLQTSQNLDYSQKKQNKFKEYLQNKISKIQQIKTQTTEITEKYFSDLKQRMDKYLVKQKKRVINSYEDNINSSINCLNHNYLYDFDTVIIKGKNEQRKISKEIFQLQKVENVRKNSSQDQNQLAIKLQTKKLIEEMILAQNHIKQTVKLIGQNLKVQMQKLVFPLVDMLAKIPKLTKIVENSSTVLIKEAFNNLEKKQKNKTKTSSKSDKFEFQQTKNPELSGQKLMECSRNLDISMTESIKMTQRLLKKSNVQNQNISEAMLSKQSHNIMNLKLKSIKEDKISEKIKKYSKTRQLQCFDLINGKSLFHVYKKSQKLQNPIEMIQENQPNLQNLKFEVFLNDIEIFQQQSLKKFQFQKYCKIQFESKPDREYLVILSSKLVQTEENRKHKFCQLYIYNYKGDLITKDSSLSFKTSETQKFVNIFQIRQHRNYLFVVSSNQVRKFNLKNSFDKKVILFGNDQKIIDAQINNSKIVLFEARKLMVHVLNEELTKIQTLAWTQFYPQQIGLQKMVPINLIPHHQFQSEQCKNTQLKKILLILPKTQIDTLQYIQNGFHKSLQLNFIDVNLKSNKNYLEEIQYLAQIYKSVFLIICKKTVGLRKQYDAFLLELEFNNPLDSEKQVNSNDRLKGKIHYLQTIKEEVTNCYYVKNQLHLAFKSGKIGTYQIC